MGDLLIRAATPEDRLAVKRVLRQSGVFNDEEVRVALELFDDGDAGGYAARVAEVGRQVMGYVCLGPAALTETSWYLYWMCVHPDAQRRGVGRALQHDAEAVVRGGGGQRIVLETSGRPDYDAARRFYAQGGYVRAGVIEDFYRDGDDCIIYVKRLT